MTLDDLAACAAALAQSEVVGVEIGEYEGDAARTAADLVDALDPIWVALHR
ncbi:MAG: hypothetical protein F2825_11170 [Actinobacteria bacterium]|nr:hypothetical protein [Actinomycetota bacterium]